MVLKSPQKKGLTWENSPHLLYKTSAESSDRDLNSLSHMWPFFFSLFFFCPPPLFPSILPEFWFSLVPDCCRYRLLWKMRSLLHIKQRSVCVSVSAWKIESCQITEKGQCDVLQRSGTVWLPASDLCLQYELIHMAASAIRAHSQDQ